MLESAQQHHPFSDRGHAAVAPVERPFSLPPELRNHRRHLYAATRHQVVDHAVADRRHAKPGSREIDLLRSVRRHDDILRGGRHGEDHYGGDGKHCVTHFTPPWPPSCGARGHEVLMRTLKRAEWPQKAAKISHEEHKVTKDQPRRTQRSRRISYTGATATRTAKTS